MIKIEINETENRKSIEGRKKKNQWNKELVLWKDQSNWKASSKTDKEKREKRQITNIRNVSGDIITDRGDVKGLIR